MFSTNRVATRFHVGDHKREVCSPLREHPLSSRRTHRGRNHTVGAGHDRPAPPCRPARHTPPRTRQSRPHAACERQASAKAGRPKQSEPRAPTRAPTPRNANTPSEHTKPQPPTEQTRPQQAPLPPPRKHKSAHATARGRSSVSAGGPVAAGRPTRTKRRHTTRARRQRTQQGAQTTLVCAVCACARKGRTAREKAGHA